MSKKRTEIILQSQNCYRSEVKFIMCFVVYQRVGIEKLNFICFSDAVAVAVADSFENADANAVAYSIKNTNAELICSCR